MSGVIQIQNAAMRGAKGQWKRGRCQQLRVVLVWLATWEAAVAHGVGDPYKPLTTEDLWRAWEWDPPTVICLGISALLYGMGIRQLWRTMRPGHGIRYWEAGCFVAGWFSLVIALLSPLHPWGRVLFSAHMTQHEILMLVAAPLMVLGRPMVAFLKALGPGRARVWVGLMQASSWSGFWSRMTHPLAAWFIHAVVLWVWHIPAWFEATIDHEWVHALQHLSFFGSALLFWWAVMHGRHKVMGFGMAVLYLFTTAIHSGGLGALITFAGTVVYPAYGSTAPAWGLTAMEDQQLGGLIMWVPGGLVYLIAGSAFVAGWLAESERRVRLREMMTDADSLSKEAT